VPLHKICGFHLFLFISIHDHIETYQTYVFLDEHIFYNLNNFWHYSNSPARQFGSFCMQNRSFISAKHVKQQYDVSSCTLRRWSEEGKLSFIRSGAEGGRRLYSAVDLARLFGEKTPASQQRHTILYGRVSSTHQRADLDRQLADLKSAYPDADECIHDIASGLNYHRPGFTSLLDKIDQGLVSKVVVTHADRLVRFGLELVEWICAKHDTEIVVLFDAQNTPDSTELQDDLLAVTTYFVARNNGRRSAENKKRRKESRQAENHQKGTGQRSSKNSVGAIQSASKVDVQLDGHGSVDL